MPKQQPDQGGEFLGAGLGQAQQESCSARANQLQGAVARKGSRKARCRQFHEGKLGEAPFSPSTAWLHAALQIVIVELEGLCGGGSVRGSGPSRLASLQRSSGILWPRVWVARQAVRHCANFPKWAVAVLYPAVVRVAIVQRQPYRQAHPELRTLAEGTRCSRRPTGTPELSGSDQRHRPPCRALSAA